MVREWARDSVTRPGSGRAAANPACRTGTVVEAAAAHWHTYRHQLAEMISVSELAMVNDDFASTGTTSARYRSH